MNLPLLSPVSNDLYYIESTSKKQDIPKGNAFEKIKFDILFSAT